MATITSSVGYLLSVDEVDLQQDVHVRLNIKKRRETVLYRTLTSDLNVNISYIETEKSTPQNNVFISDRSRSLPENTLEGSEDDKYVILPYRVFSTRSKKFLVTDRFTTETPAQPATPLFYKHIFKYFNPDLTDWSNRELLNVDFIDIATMKKINETIYLLDSDNGVIFSNFKNSFDNGTVLLTAVKYNVKITNGSTSNIYSYQELLNNKPIFHQAVVQDLDDWGNLLYGSDAYLQEEVPGGIYYRITLPQAASYAYQETAPSRIRLLSPTTVSLNEPWNVRISNGEFMSSVIDGIDSYRSARYYIPEYLTQGFVPYPYYRFMVDEECSRVTGYIIKSPRNVVNDTTSGFYITIKVYDAQNEYIEYAFSNDTSLIGNVVSGGSSTSVRYLNEINSVDENGFIELNTFIPEDRTILITYYTESDDIDFVDVDFNPINNKDILEQRIVIYINPETLNTGTLSRTIHYLEVDKLGRITYCSQADDGGLDPATTKLLSEDFYTDGTPKRDFYYDIESTMSGLATRLTDASYSGFVEDFSFVDKYTVETRLTGAVIPSGHSILAETYSGWIPFDHYLSNLDENPGFLLLGDIRVGESEVPLDSTIYDVRVRGGGIKEVYDTEAEDDEDEAQFYWDKEYPYPGIGAFMVEVPSELLESNGGDYTIQQLKEIIGKHAEFGSYQIVKTYNDLDPTLVSGIVSSNLFSGVTISSNINFVWASYGAGTEYDLYLSTDGENFTVANGTTITDTGVTNEYEVLDLLTNVTYYAYLEATRNGTPSQGATVSIRTDPYVYSS